MPKRGLHMINMVGGKASIMAKTASKMPCLIANRKTNHPSMIIIVKAVFSLDPAFC
jgi:hypothetical protein